MAARQTENRSVTPQEPTRATKGIVVSKTKRPRPFAGRILAVLAGLVAIVALMLLTYNISREMRLLQSAQSDNIQWSLAQIDVEFLELSRQQATLPVDLKKLRRRFDVFYSRISIVQSASVFRDLRQEADFKRHLARVRGYLDMAVKLIDLPDEALLQSIPEIITASESIRPDVRGLANSGLDYFAKSADIRRTTIQQTMIKLALLVIALLGALGFGIIHLNRLNAKGRRRQSELHNAMQRSTTITSTSLDAVVISDFSGNILEFNPAAEKIFGHFAEDVIGRNLGVVMIPEKYRPLHQEGMKRMKAGGERRVTGKGRVKLEALRANGEIFPIELAIQSALTDKGEIFIAFVRDISAQVAVETELMAARDKALASEKMKTDFLATMSHEIRTPLNGLLGNLSLLHDTQLNKQQARYLGNMETSGRLLMNHVSDVLDITRYDAGKLSIRNVPIDISGLLQDIIDNQSGTASANETTLEWGWNGAPVTWIASDPNRLQHILINLIGNAVKFTKQGKVTVTAEAIEDGEPTLRFDIKDTGPGIDSELANHIFDDFVTGNTTYDRDVGGTGLGLSIAKRFANALGGDIGVESTQGEGSLFWVTIPLMRQEAPSAQPAKEKARKTDAKLDVLIIEDNEINRVVVREMLVADGHSVTEAFDGREGVRVANDQRFDFILMDISMPVMDGRAAAREIRSGSGPNGQTPIVALTANAMAEEQVSFLADGMDAILSKPLSRDSLRAVLADTQRDPQHDMTGILDHSLSAETREALGPEGYKKLCTRFTEEADELVAWLSSDDAAELSQIAAQAHKIAGSAAVFGTVDFREALLAIQNAANAGNDAQVKTLIKALPARWHVTKAVLSELLK